MNKELLAISPKTAAKLSAVILFGITAVFIIPMAIIFAIVPPEPDFPSIFLAFFVVAPFMYALFGAIFGALAAWLYNVAARRLGGLQISVVDKHDA